MFNRRLSKEKKEKLQQFMNVASQSQEICMEILNRYNWNVDQALDYYFTNMDKFPQINNNTLKQFFNQYKDDTQEDEVITQEGMGKLFEDIGLSPEDPTVLALIWNMNCESYIEVKKEEFLEGCQKLGVYNKNQLQKKVPYLKQQFDNKNTFIDIYKYSYQYYCEKGKKVLQLDEALQVWQLLFSGAHSWPMLTDWIDFLQNNYSGRAVSRDTWNQLVDFKTVVKPDFSNYDESAAWPYMIDEFVEYMREKQG